MRVNVLLWLLFPLSEAGVLTGNGCGVSVPYSHKDSIDSLDEAVPCLEIQNKESFQEIRIALRKQAKLAGGWNSWESWGQCSETCGSGRKARSRTCFDAEKCTGSNEGSKPCRIIYCPVNGGWTEWSAWSSCPVTCGDGELVRTRSCENPEPQFGGQQCQGSSVESTPCEPMLACCFSGDTNHDGDDIDTLNNFPSKEDCQKECRKHVTCVAIVYDTLSSTCYLKSDATSATSSNGKVLGPRFCSGEEPHSMEFCFTHEDVELPCTQSAVVHSSSPAFVDGVHYFGPDLVLENKCDALEGTSLTYYIGADLTVPIYITLDLQCLDYIPLLYIKNSQNIWGQRATSNYSVSISQDASTWTKVCESVLPDLFQTDCQVEVFGVPVDQVARYVKLDMLGYYGAGAGAQYFNARPTCKPTVELVSAPPEYTNAASVTSFAAGTCTSLAHVGVFDETVRKDIIWQFSCDPTYIGYVEITNGNLGDRAARDIEIFLSYDNMQWEQVASETLPDTRNTGSNAPVQNIPINKCGNYLKLSMINGYGLGMELHKVKINTEFNMDSSNKDKCGPHLVYIALDNTLKDTSLTYPAQSLQYPAVPAGFVRSHSCGMHYRGGFLICDTTVGNCYHHKFHTSEWRLLPSTVPIFTIHGQVSCATHPESERMHLAGGYDDALVHVNVGSGKAATCLFNGDTWESRADMDRTRRCQGAIFLSKDEVLIVGGVDNDLYPDYDLKSVQVYHVDTNTYENKADLNEPNSCVMLAKLHLDNKDMVLAVGAYNHVVGQADFVELYDIAANQWTTIASLLRPQYMQGVYVYNNVAHVFGGLVAPHRDAYILQTEPDFAWVQQPDMPLDFWAGVVFTY